MCNILDLNGKFAVVTGDAGGIGRVHVRGLVYAGADFIVWRRKRRLI